MIGCRPEEMWGVAGVRCWGRSRNTGRECVNDGDMKVLGSHPEWVVFSPEYVEGLHMGKRLTLA